jgi:hypothetical protein
MADNLEFARFDAVARKVFSVSHDEIVKREKEYKRKRKLAKQKRVKISPASRASSVRVKRPFLLTFR